MADYTFIYTITLFYVVRDLWFYHVLFVRVLGGNGIPVLSMGVDKGYGYVLGSRAG